MKPGKNLIGDYRQSFTQKVYEATMMIGLDHRGKVGIIKNRHGTTEVSTENIIDILTEMLVQHIFDGGMDIFQESMKNELKKAIYQTLEGGVAKCEPRSGNELSRWVSKVLQRKVSSDILTTMEK